MTIEHRVVYDLSDIIALSVECVKCHAKISFQMDQTIRVPYECPGCRETLLDRMNPQQTAMVEALIDDLKALSTAKSPRLRVRLEFDTSPPSR